MSATSLPSVSSPPEGAEAVDQPTRLAVVAEGESERRIRALREILPEAFSDGYFVPSRAAALLGLAEAPAQELYGLNWSGKSEAISAIQTRSVATLRPDVERSRDYIAAEHVFVEGDNLEALRVMQRSYSGQVDLVYIDPPYNTGKDFVYKDNFKAGMDAYLEFSGQTDEAGQRLSSNTEASGRYHSSWLSMMYPRLTLAKNVLRRDGVILVSIDDHEVHNLRHLMDEIFGPENFIADLVWEKNRKNDAKLFSLGHEYMLVYARSKAFLNELKTRWRQEKPGSREIIEKVAELRAAHGTDFEAIEDALGGWYKSLSKSHPSKKLARYKRVDSQGIWRDDNISWPGGGGPRYDVIHPVTGKPCAVPERGWIFASPETMQQHIDVGLVEFREDHTNPPIRKTYLVPPASLIDIIDADEAELEDVLQDDAADGVEEGEEALAGQQVMPSVIYKQAQVVTKYLRKLMGSKLFDNPKDQDVLASLIDYCTSSNPEAIVMDFFAGSGSTGDAVMRLNESDGGNRRFVLVQLDEPTSQKSAARKAGYETIADLCWDRLTRVNDSLTTPVGIRSFKLGMSNFHVWDTEHAPTDGPGLEQHVALFSESLAADATDDGIAIEILLKEGIPLHVPLHEMSIEGAKVIEVPASGSSLLIVLARTVGDALVDKLTEMDSKKVVMLETAFAGNDAAKSNAFYRFRDAGITLKTV